MGRVISTAIQFIDGFTKPSKEVINSMRSMGNEAIKAGKQIQSAGKTITSVGSTLTKAITVPIAGVATAAVKTAADFEAAMSEVGAISGASAQDLATLTAKAKEMGATTSFSASESAEAMKYMAMAGWKTADMTAGIAGIMNLAAAAGEDLGTTSDIVTDGLTAFGMSAKESGRFADVMAAASTNANTNVTMLGESFKYCAATAGAMGYNIEDISVALGVMANAGIKGSTAGTTLKNVIANMAKPTDAQAAVMQKLGISLTDSSGNMKSFAEVMNNLRSSFNGLSETEKASYATTLAGKESMSGLLTIVNASAADFDKLTEAINGSSGSAEAMAAKMLDNLKGQLTLLKSAVEGIAITIGDKLLPYLKKFVSWVQKAADYINNLSDAQVDSIMKWAAIAAAIPPIIMVFGKVVTMVGTVQRTFGTITKTIANFGGIIGTITSPAGIVIGVLAAIAVAAALIIKNWDQVKGFLQNVGNWFKNAFEKAGFSVQGFKDKFTSIGNTVGSIAGKISSFVKNIAGIFKKEFAGSIGEGADAAGGAFETIVGGAVAAFDTIVTAVDKGLKAFNAILEFFGGAFTGNWDSAAQSFRNSIKNIFPPDIAAGIINVFNTLLPGIKAVVSGIKATFTGLVQDVKKIFDGFTTIFKGIGTMLKGIFSGDWKGALNGLKTIARGALSGLVNIIKAPFKLIAGTVKGAINSFKSLNIVKSIFTAVGNAIKKVLSQCGVDMKKFSANLNNIKTRASSIINNLKAIFSTVFGAIGKVVRAAANVIAAIFGKKISSTCSTAKAVLQALKIVVGVVFGAIATLIKKNMAVIVPVVKVAFSAIKGAISAAVNTITSLISGVLTIFDGLTTFISGVFTGNWRKAWEGIKTIFKGVFDSLAALCKAPINAVIGIINGAISGINKLNISIPDWVPGLGGKSFGINIPTIPMLYKGTDNWKGGAAIIHDRGGEIVDLPQGSRVYPHDKSVEMARKDGAAQSGSGGITLNIQKLADKIEVRSDEDIDRIAEALALKLKKVAFNTP